MGGTTTLERIESFLPGESVRIDEVAERLRLRRAEIGVFRKIYGLDRIHYEPGGDLFELVLPAARQVVRGLADPRRVRYVIYAHTMQTLTPPDVDAAQVIRDELGLPWAEAFALTQQACVSSLGAIDLAGELLRAEAPEGACALIVSGERAYSPKVQLIPNSSIMSEAAAACLVTVDGDGDLVRSHVTRTLGQFASGLDTTKEDVQGFGQVYGKVLGEVIVAAAERAGLSFDDIDLVIPHNVNAVSWKATIKEMGADPARFFLDNVPLTSHLFSSDVFVNYTTLRDQGRLVTGRNYVLVSVGLGATFGATVITHRRP